ncbi:hypothetical protein EJ110_NYTH29329 [Nymphaea thermarum]|nr:hypothetical protein EJ110_NYTH29329 [Nymphaea thermarum]
MLLDFYHALKLCACLQTSEHRSITWLFADKLLLKAIVMNNLPVNLLQSMDFKNFVVEATNFGLGYILSSSETTR